MLRLRLRFAGLLAFNGLLTTLAASACGSDGGDASSSSSSSSSASSGGASSSGASSSGGSSGTSTSSGGSSGTSSSGGTNDGGADADSSVPFVPIQGLDSTFGTNAGFTTSSAFAGHDYLDTMVRQSTGKIVTVGINNFNQFNSNNDFSSLVISRFTTTGAVDTTFGNAGIRMVPVGAAITPLAAAVQPDDKIVVLGRTVEPTKAQLSRVIVRFTADGALDATFGGGAGFVFDGATNGGGGIGVQSDGKILVGDQIGGKISVVRFTTAGVRDNTYGTGGVADAGSGTGTWGLRVQSDDKAVVVGTAYDNNISKAVVVVARFGTDGLPDTGFNTTGRVTAPPPTGTTISLYGFDLDDQGRAIVDAYDSGNKGIFGRFTTGGALDATYGTGGWITLTTADHGFVPEPNGKIIVVNRTANPPLLKRYDSTGALDMTYAGGTGSVSPLLPVWVYVNSLLRSPTGDLFAGGGGALVGGGRSYMVVSRTAADGTPDSNYGTSGRAYTGSGASRENALGVVIQTDGKIVVAGGMKDFWHRSFLQRYTANGLVDGTFGTNGFRETSDIFDFQFSGFGMTPTGKFLMARGPNTQDDFGVYQYNSDGTRDNNYGTNGLAALAAGVSTNQGPRGMVVDPTGRALLVGAFDNDVAMVRFTTAGLPDNTFGGGTGYVKYGYAANVAHQEALEVAAVRADNKIVAAGHTNGNILVARYEADGTPDNSFDSDGWVSYVKPYFKASAVLLQPDDKIIVVGIAANTTRTLVIARLTSAGALDTTFNGTGLVEVAMPDPIMNNAYAPAVLNPDGTILVAHSSASGPHLDMVVSRYTSAGVLDATFATAGQLPLPLSIGDDVPSAAALQPDGKLVVTGRTWTPAGGNDVALLRLK